MHHPFCRGWGEDESLTKFSKKGGLTGSQFLEWHCWEREGDFFQGGGGGLQFLHKIFREEFMKKQYIGRNCIKREGLDGLQI